MSTLKVFAVFDSAVTAFERPFFARHAAEAIRSFEDAVRDPQSPFIKHPLDFTLFQLGDFNDVSGEFSGGPPQRLAAAADFMMKDISPGK